MAHTVRMLSLLLLVLAAACGDARERKRATELARRVGGPETSDARPFRVGEDRWVAALRVTQGPPGAREVVLVNAAGRLVVPRLFAGPGPTPERLWGLEDVDGDGQVEVWAAAIVDGDERRLDLRAYAPRTQRVYRLHVPVTSAGPDSTRRDFSFNVVEAPAVQGWLTRRAGEVSRPDTAAP